MIRAYIEDYILSYAEMQALQKREFMPPLIAKAPNKRLDVIGARLYEVKKHINGMDIPELLHLLGIEDIRMRQTGADKDKGSVSI